MNWRSVTSYLCCSHRSSIAKVCRSMLLCLLLLARKYRAHTLDADMADSGGMRSRQQRAERVERRKKRGREHCSELHRVTGKCARLE